jgi:hypothetical protein
MVAAAFIGALGPWPTTGLLPGRLGIVPVALKTVRRNFSESAE